MELRWKSWVKKRNIMSKFLEDLKKAADSGEFNSDAAKKINEISEAAEDKATNMDTNELESSLKKRMEETPVEPLSDDEITELNSEYEEKMAEIKEVDAANNQLAILIEIEDMVKASINDMLEHVDVLETTLKEKLDADHYAGLKKKIEAVKASYEKQDRTSVNF
jgi:hypothetical protein